VRDVEMLKKEMKRVRKALTSIRSRLREKRSGNPYEKDDEVVSSLYEDDLTGAESCSGCLCGLPVLR
jgi:hypothetical protein